jgi:glutathione S-transferase
MVLQIYLDPCTINSRKVLAGLDAIEAKYDYHYINYFDGGHKAPDFTKINPCQTVPAATDGDLVLTESNAILQYAADETGSPLYPVDRKQRAAVNKWLFWESSAWFASCYVYVVEYVVKPLLSQQPDENVIKDQAPRWNQLAGILDAQLGQTKWLAGDELTIADISVAAPMHLWEDSELPVEKYKNLDRWYKDVQKLPAWQKTQEAVDSALVPNKKKGVKAELNCK